MGVKGRPISEATAVAGSADAPSLEDLQKKGREEQKGHRILGCRQKKVLFGRELEVATTRAAARERKMRRSRRAR